MTTKRSRLHTINEHEPIEALRRKTGEVGEDLSAMASLALDVGGDQVARIRNAANQNYKNAKEQLVSWEETLRSHIRQSPVKALLIAAGLGMVVARVMRRR